LRGLWLQPDHPHLEQKETEQTEDLAQLRAAIAARSVSVRTLGTKEDMFLPHVQLWSLDEPPAHREVRAELDRLRWEKYRLLHEYHQGRNESLRGLLVPRLGHVNHFSATPEGFCQTILDAQSQIDAELVRFKPLTIHSGACVGPDRIPRAHYRARNLRLLADQIRWTAHGTPGSSDDVTPQRGMPRDKPNGSWKPGRVLPCPVAEGAHYRPFCTFLTNRQQPARRCLHRRC